MDEDEGYEVEPDLPLDEVKLSYTPGKAYTTGQVVGCADMAGIPPPPSPEAIQRAKDFWTKRKQ